MKAKNKVSKRIKVVILLETPRVVASIEIPTPWARLSASEAGALLDRLNTSVVNQVAKITKARRAGQKKGGA